MAGATSHTNFSQSDLVMNIGLELQDFHWTAGLLSEVLDWDLTEGGFSTSLVSLPRWHRVIIP
jgi:hypothetical protein